MPGERFDNVEAKQLRASASTHGWCGDAARDCWGPPPARMERNPGTAGENVGKNAARAKLPPEFPPVQVSALTDAPGNQKLQFNITVNDNHVLSPYNGLEKHARNTFNQSMDKQGTDAAGAVIPGLVTGLGDTARGLMFVGNGARDVAGVALDDVQIGCEKLTYPDLAEANAARLSERLHKLLEKYRPVAESVQQAYAPIEADLEDIGAHVDANPVEYSRLITDPLKAAGNTYERFSSMSPADQVFAVMRFDGQILGGGALGKLGECAVGVAPKVMRAGLGELKEQMELFKKKHASVMDQMKNVQVFSQLSGDTGTSCQMPIPEESPWKVSDHVTYMKGDKHRWGLDDSRSPAPRSLGDIEARDWYNSKVAEIGVIEQEMRQEGRSLKEIFETTTRLRYEAKLQARELMADQNLATSLPPPQTPEEILRKYGGNYERAIQASKRTNRQVNSSIDNKREGR